MTRPRQKRAATKEASPTKPHLTRPTQLRIVVIAAVLIATIAGVLLSWDRLFSIPPERVVNVYRVHGCTCALVWIRSLKAEGFVVRTFEYETLKYVRTSLREPASLHGCHVGAFLGYFIEGHVPGAALRQLALTHPQGGGLATQATARGSEEHLDAADASPVMLFDNEGRSRLWFKPEH